MLQTILNSLRLLSKDEKRRGVVVILMMVVMAFFETLGIASIMPFLAVLADPTIVEKNETLNALYQALAFASTGEFLIFLGISVFTLLFTSAVFRTVTQYVMNRFIEMRRHSIGLRLLETYLRQPYTFFLSRQSSDMAKNILSEVDQVIENVFRPGVRTLSFSIVALSIIGLLVAANPAVALVLLAIMGGLYLGLYAAFRNLLGRLGAERADSNQRRFKSANEAIAGIKPIKLLGLERAYLAKFTVVSRRLSRHIALHKTISQAPKYLVELIAMGGILALTLTMLLTTGELEQVLPLIGLYALAGYKLLPALQQIYSGATQLRFAAAAVGDLEGDLRQRKGLETLPSTEPARLAPRRTIELRDVSFAYPGATSPAISSLTLTIKVGSSVGIVGGTGAGKTTVMDLLLGLIAPTEGTVVLDSVVLCEDIVRSWRKAIGYVPQEIFLTDATVAENIAFGLSPEAIDASRVEHAARLAQIHDFVVSDLPKGYQTAIGERGIRLSGGQRQRLGIARALYYDPPVLLFDEATSALDALTERALMDAIATLRTHKTLILIAHRLTTIRNCDCIFLLDHGRLLAQGTFDELSTRSELFRALAA
jgi:ABC-type multidrug transport system fused ATPase/permease subunit